MERLEFYGEKLKLVRLLYGFSQAELGEQVAVTRQYIHQLETGTKILPTSEMVKALCDVLAVYPSFFAEPLINAVKQDQCHFRKQRSTLVSTVQQVVAHSTLFERFLSFIEKNVTLPEVSFPHLSISNDEEIESSAQYCREYWNLTKDRPINSISRVIENAGGIILSLSGIDVRFDAFSIDVARPVIFRSTVKDNATRIRFDLAHELAHLVIHQGICTGDIETERQAHRFAGAFLIPREQFVKEFPKSKRLDWLAIFNMKKKWKMSVQAIIRRAKDLNIIGDAQYRTANVYISKKGYKTNEPYEPKLAEKPELLNIAASTLKKSLGIGIFDVGRDIGLKPRSVMKLMGSSIAKELFSSANNVVDISSFRLKDVSV